MSEENKWSQPDAPPPPLFTGKKERDLVKQVNDELIERVIGQTVIYYPIDVERTNYHPVYGEALQKNFLPPVRVQALIEWGGIRTEPVWIRIRISQFTFTSAGWWKIRTYMFAREILCCMAIFIMK